MADYEKNDGGGENFAPYVPPEVEYTSKWLKENTQIHGWLSFFLVVMVLGAVVSLVVTAIGVFDKASYSNGWIVASDIVFIAEMLAVAIYSVWLFTARKPAAVFFAKVYVVVVLLTNVFTIVNGSVEDGQYNRVISGLIWSCIWFTYLSLSNQVNEVIPKSFRKVSKADIGLVVSVVLVPIILLCVGVVVDASSGNYMVKEQEEFSKIPVAWNERNDSRVIFKIPDGFTCEENVNEEDGESTTYYYIENEEIGNGTLFSVYDFDTSISYFEECAEIFKGDDPDEAICNVEQSTTYINGRECYYKITTFEFYGVYVYWRFYFLFDKKLDKVFVASLYDYGEGTSYVNELLYSVKFEKP